MDDRQGALEANAAFYKAFASGDIAAMEKIWALDLPVACIHPGWSRLEGRVQVMESWSAIMADGPPPIECREPHVMLYESAALVLCYEVVGETALAASNVFVKQDDAWVMTLHHAGHVAHPDPNARSSELLH